MKCIEKGIPAGVPFVLSGKYRRIRRNRRSASHGRGRTEGHGERSGRNCRDHEFFCRSQVIMTFSLSAACSRKNPPIPVDLRMTRPYDDK